MENSHIDPRYHYIDLWYQANRKEISTEDFKNQTGSDFHNFLKYNRKECMARWRREEKLKKISHQESVLEDKLAKLMKTKMELFSI